MILIALCDMRELRVDIIESFLKDRGPALSGEVAEHLVKIMHIAPTAARQRIARVGGQVKKLGYVTFPRKARFMYLEEQFGSRLYWDSLTKALLRTNSAYGLAIAALLQRDGLIPHKQFAIACGAPVKQAKHLSPETIFRRLNEAGLLELTTVPSVGECVSLVQSANYYQWRGDDVRARLVTESLLLTAIRDWVRKLGIVSYETVATREGDKPAMVGTFAWDLTAPSYLGFLTKRSKEGKPKPGFFVCDVHLGSRMTAESVRPFINKCKTLRQLRNIAPCMQMYVAHHYTAEAFQLLKANGIIPATPANLFGEEVAQGLVQLSVVLRQAASSTIDPIQFDALFKKFGKIEGAALQLRGTLFEYLSAEIARKTISPQVKMNRIFKSPDGVKSAESDVLAVREDTDVTFIECKGYSPYGEVSITDMKRWLQHNVPVIYSAARAHPDWRRLAIHFEFWTTAPLSTEAAEMLELAKSTVKPERYTVAVRLSDAILATCRLTKDSGLTTAFEKHFIRHDRKVPPDRDPVDKDMQ